MRGKVGPFFFILQRNNGTYDLPPMIKFKNFEFIFGIKNPNVV